MTKKIYLLLILSALFISNINAQLLASWQLNGALGNEPSKSATNWNSNLSLPILNRSGGVNANSLANAFAGTNYTANGTQADANTNGRGFTFDLSVFSGYQMSLSTLDYRVRRSGTGCNAFIWQYSTNGTTYTDIGSPISYTATTTGGDAQTQLNLASIPALQNLTNSTIVTFRLIAWGATGTGGTFSIGRSLTNGATDFSLSVGGTTAVLVNSPTASVLSSSATTICANSSANLSVAITNGTSPYTVTYSDGSNNIIVNNYISGANIPVTPTANTTYSLVSVVDANSLSSTGLSGTPTINVNPLPNVTATSNATAICAGQSVTLTGGGAPNLSWNNGVTNNVAFTPSNTLTYEVTGTDANNCTNTSSVQVVVNPLPIVTASTTTYSVCDGQSVTLSGNGASTYLWDNSVADNVSFTPTATLTYNVTGTDANTCSNTASIQITHYNLPIVTASPISQTVCENTTTSVYGGGANTYTWSGGISNNSSFNVTSSNTYIVTGTDGNNCTNSAIAIVNMNPAPMVNANATTTSLCENTTLTLTGSGNATSYVWDNGVDDAIPFVTNTSATFEVTGTDANSCTATASIFINVNAANATLSNSNVGNTNSTSGMNSGNDSQLANSSINYYSGSCNLIATINSTLPLGSTTSIVHVENSIITHNSQPFIARWFEITPTNNNPAEVIFYVTQDDFNDYNVFATANGWPLLPINFTDALGMQNIRITKNSSAGLSNNPIVLTPTNIFWNAAKNYWEITVSTPSFSQFRIHSVNPNNVALSAKIENFKGQKNQTSDILTWTTTSETNNSHFNILYSVDAKDFSVIGKINTNAINGNSQMKIDYSFENKNIALGHNYYQLQQVDFDEKTTTNATLVDIIRNENGNTISVYPNPILNDLNIDFYTAKSENLSIKLVDMSGRVLKEINTNINSGTNHLEMNVNDVATGVYAIQFIENGVITNQLKIKK